MFHFRKKQKALPPLGCARKRGGFVKKPVISREIPLTSQEAEAKKTRDGFYFVYFFLWTAFACVTVYVALFSSFLQLQTVQVEGASAISEHNVRQLIQESLSGNYAGGVSKGNLLAFRREKMEADIRDRFKKIASVELTRVFPHTLIARVKERQTLVLWCVQDTCFYVDENGYAYSQVDTSVSGENLGHFLKIIDTSGQSVDMDEPLIDQDFVRFAAQIQDGLQQKLGIAVDAECSTPSRFSDTLTLKTQEGWAMQINVRLPMDKSLQTLGLLFKKEISEERRHRLKYIDLRTENRVYYSVEGEIVSAPKPPEEEPAPEAEAADALPKKEKKKNE
ncbi:MAG: FtsQ-type POTRA domain-containing protein [Candidatus Moranbacteria bacterium]|nr:FtsQ-type POTRA domain-containing protein [Candidatus Moranbacteria bacterium]